jgi:predicted permease
MAAVGLLLLMACGNLANLLLARATDREKELAVRTAMGAAGNRLVRQVLTEILLLGTVGGLAGLGLARWGSGTLLTLVPSSLPRQSEVGVDPTVLLFTTGVVLVSTLLVGLVPSLQVAGRDPGRGMRVGGRVGTAGRERHRTNRAIVVFQLSLAAVLLVGAGLLVRSLDAIRTVDPGFRSEGVLTAQIMLPNTRYQDVGTTLAFFDQLQERVESLPRVSSVALSMDHPMQNTWWNGITFLNRPPPEPGESPRGIFRPVSTGYFSTMGIPLVEGRAFDRADRYDQPGVMVVNQAFVERHFPEGNPLGERIAFTVGRFIWGSEAPTEFEIVGVVGDVRFNGLREPSEPAFHIPMHQFPYAAVKVMVRTSGDPAALAGSLQAEVWELDPDLPVTDIRTMAQVLATAVAQDRFNAILLGAFALAALVLAAAGIYGVLSYTVAQRTSEMGIRMALGAEPGLVLGMVVRDAAAMAGIGLGVGLATSLVLSHFLASLLFGIPTYDPPVLLGVSLLLGLVALASGLVPALRAARTDPRVALRAE